MDYVSSWFQAALLPDRWNVAGVSCSALTVWHVFALEQMNNPYFTCSPCDRDAAASLLMFCSSDYRDGKRLFQQPLFRSRRMSEITGKLKASKWTDIHAAITDYVSTCSRTPSHRQLVSGGKSGVKPRKVVAPICWALVDFLSAGNPSKINEAWDTPYAVAKCMFDAHRDINGDDDSLESQTEERNTDAILEAE